jgi:hypothetical protein
MQCSTPVDCEACGKTIPSGLVVPCLVADKPQEIQGDQMTDDNIDPKMAEDRARELYDACMSSGARFGFASSDPNPAPSCAAWKELPEFIRDAWRERAREQAKGASDDHDPTETAENNARALFDLYSATGVLCPCPTWEGMSETVRDVWRARAREERYLVMKNGMLGPAATVENIAAKFLDAGMEFWGVKNPMSASTAVVWARHDDGRLAIFTRGEYAARLLAAVPGLYEDPVDLAAKNRGDYLDAHSLLCDTNRRLCAALLPHERSPTWDDVVAAAERAAAEVTRLRARVRIEAEDLTRLGVTRAHVEAWLRVHGWARSDNGSIACRSVWRRDPSGFVVVTDSISESAQIINALARVHRRPGLDILDEMAAMEVTDGEGSKIDADDWRARAELVERERVEREPERRLHRAERFEAQLWRVLAGEPYEAEDFSGDHGKLLELVSDLARASEDLRRVLETARHISNRRLGAREPAGGQ